MIPYLTQDFWILTGDAIPLLHSGCSMLEWNHPIRVKLMYKYVHTVSV